MRCAASSAPSSTDSGVREATIGTETGPIGEGDREEIAAFLLRLRAARVGDGRLLQAAETVPRRLFVPTGVVDPYADCAFPIPCGETMPSAFHAVQLVADLRVEPTSRILEVGTGSGYVTALLAKLGGRVTTLDRYRTLLTAAEARLKTCRIAGANFVLEDGREGYRDAAPFDRILLHAAVEVLPRAFLEQLAQQGQIVCALGPGNGAQTLVRLQRVGSRLEREDLRPVRYQGFAAGIARVL